MSAPEPDPKTYSHAIEMLKRRNVRLKWFRVGGLVVIGVLLLGGEVRLAGAAALALGAGLLLMRDPLTTNRFLAAEKFVLTDDQGRVRAVLGMDEQYTTLRYFTESGQVALDLSGSSDHSSLLLRLEARDEEALICCGTKLGPGLQLHGAQGKMTFFAFGVPGVTEELGREWAPGAYVSIEDGTGRKRVALDLESGELGATSLRLTSGTGEAEIWANSDGQKASLKLRERDVWRSL
jgi:hypothetical protein